MEIEKMKLELIAYKAENEIMSYKKIFILSDLIIDNEKIDCRTNPFYEFVLEIIDELMSLRIGIGSMKLFDADNDLDLEIITKEMALLKRVVPKDKKMQNIIEGIFSI